MASLKERLKVAAWFLRRPAYHAEFVRYTTRRLRSIGLDRSAQMREATALCESVCVEPDAAILAVTGRPPRGTVRELFPDELARADAALREAPSAMHGAGNLELIYYLTEHVAATSAIETGVSAGWSSLAFLLSMRTRSGSKLVSTDMPYPGGARDAERSVGCVVLPELRPQWQCIVAPDHDALPAALAILPELDICHYDSDKSYEGRMWAYPKLWHTLRSGGFFLSDDIDDNFAFFHFCAEVDRRPVVVRMAASKRPKYVGIAVKP
ncbi:MAG TPA: class I SAM-dependent methyltransferase [Kofleriaceae bacterium]|nr:class I SAM-dependent methyltransferase [Kofleriaceae bacterium]